MNAENQPTNSKRVIGRPFPKGVSGNPKGRPKGQTLKEYQAEKFRTMTDEEKKAWIIEHKISGSELWRMSEGNPASDVTSGGEKIQFPIMGGTTTPNE